MIHLTGLSLADTSHATWILASDWSDQKTLQPCNTSSGGGYGDSLYLGRIVAFLHVSDMHFKCYVLHETWHTGVSFVSSTITTHADVSAELIWAITASVGNTVLLISRFPASVCQMLVSSGLLSPYQPSPGDKVRCQPASAHSRHGAMCHNVTISSLSIKTWGIASLPACL